MTDCSVVRLEVKEAILLNFRQEKALNLGVFFIQNMPFNLR